MLKEMENIRVAWLFPSLTLGFYRQPVLREFAKKFPQTIVYTGYWPGYVPGCEDTFPVEVVGKNRYIKLDKSAAAGYGAGFALPPLGVIPALFKFKPDVIFVTTFTLWTLISLILRPLTRWKVVVIYSGSSPNTDRQKLWLRKLIAGKPDAYLTNSQGGKKYLVEVLKVEERRVFARLNQMPDREALLKSDSPTILDSIDSVQHPVFLYVGQIIKRKGISFLLEACVLLNQWGHKNYTVVIVGKGEERKELENWVKKEGIEEQVKWAGWVNYGNLGSYFQKSDVFVFPTLEDIWGMVAIEAMLFAKPVLCSQEAGAVEMVVDGENGYKFDPYKPEQLAELMCKFISQPDLSKTMGDKSLEKIAPHTPEAASDFVAEVVDFALGNS
jgi:glycosyltransferase involved in cell wall biosynthesis